MNGKIQALIVIVLIVGGFTALVIGFMLSLPFPQALGTCGFLAFAAGLVCLMRGTQ